MNVLPLKGIPAYHATMATHKLLYGLKFLPAYMGETYEDFLSKCDAMDEAGQEAVVRSAAVFVKLDQEEILDMAQFAADSNGIPFGAPQLKNAPPEQIHEVIVLVAKEVISKHKIRLVSEAEKKN